MTENFLQYHTWTLGNEVGPVFWFIDLFMGRTIDDVAMAMAYISTKAAASKAFISITSH